MVKKPTLSLISLCLLGFLLRLIAIDQSLWLDEAAQALASQASLLSIINSRVGDFHPPLFYFLTHYWQLISTSDSWLRLLPVIFGTLNILAIYYLAKAYLADKIVTIFNHQFDLNLIASFLLSIAPFHIYYSQEYRSYSLLCLLCTLSAVFFKKLTSLSGFIALSVVNTLIIYTHYSGFIFLFTELIFCLLYTRNNLRRYLFSLLFSLVGFLPWLPYFIQQLTSGVNIDSYLPGWRQVLTLPTLTALPVILFKLLAGRINLLSRYVYGLYAVIVIGLVFLTSFVTRRQHLFFWVFFPLLITILISLALPQSQPFRLIYTLPWLILIIVQAAPRSPKTLLSLAIYISLFGCIMYFTRPRLQREHWRPAVNYLASQSAPVIVKFPEAFAPLRWYAPHLPYVPAVPAFPSTPDQVNSRLSQAGSPASFLLVSYLSDLTDPQLNVEKWLTTSDYSPVTTTDFPGVGFITLYTHADSR